MLRQHFRIVTDDPTRTFGICYARMLETEWFRGLEENPQAFGTLCTLQALSSQPCEHTQTETEVVLLFRQRFRL